MEEQNTTTVKKQKITKKWWFWLIVVLCGLLIISSFSDGDSSSEDSPNDESNLFEVTEKADKPIGATTQMNEESYKMQCERLSYDSLARNPEQYKDKKVVFSGKVIQVMEEGNSVVLRVNVTKGEYGLYQDTVYVTYTRDASEGRILEDDIITFYGTYKGLITYKTVMNSTVTIPRVDAKYIELS